MRKKSMKKLFNQKLNLYEYIKYNKHYVLIYDNKISINFLTA